MTGQEKQKLNKKLAEWIGFKTGKEPNVSGYYLFCGYEDKTICCSANFTDSLDACFEWLVPKGYLEFGEIVLNAWIRDVITYGYYLNFKDSAEQLPIRVFNSAVLFSKAEASPVSLENASKKVLEDM